MNKKLGIEISSDLDYEKMVVNITQEGRTLAILNCEKGKDEVEIEILSRYEDRILWKLEFNEFVETLNLALKTLKTINEEDTRDTPVLH
ncbi:MAG: hypothetical protein BGO14_00835 [Chlamydiales bacterium 38-26]|nr:hypothetical protein [Chlamydiales bacterium]OJV07267.1 MAG: hypothetical protein BGO14_00835 [Chlamydiales bacterium 38-26]